MKPSVLFVASTGSHIRNFHLPYLRSFQERGWSVHVACGAPAGDIPFADKVVELPFKKKMTAPANFRAADLLRRAIRKENYALITTHTSLAAFFARFALLGSKKRPPLVNLSHGYLYDDDTSAIKRTVLRGAERLVAPVTDLVLTMNAWDRQEAQQYHLGKRVDFVPGVGVDFSRLSQREAGFASSLRADYGIPDDAFVLIYAAEFSARKNQEFLIRAMTKLPSHVRLVLGGQGALLEDCRALAQEIGVANQVVFPGYIHVAEWYPAADAVVSSSRSEGLPFHIMEAMYLSVPVIASAVKGHTDLIREGETGLLYPFGDEEAFVRQVTRLSVDAALGDSLAANAKAEVLQYGLDEVLPQVMAAYEVLCPNEAVLV